MTAMPVLLPCRRISAIPAALPPPAGGTRLICATIRVPEVEVDAVEDLRVAVDLCLPPPPLTIRITTTTATTSVVRPSSRAPPRRELGRGARRGVDRSAAARRLAGA